MAREVKSLSKGHTERKWGVEFNLEFVKLHSLSPAVINNGKHGSEFVIWE